MPPSRQDREASTRGRLILGFGEDAPPKSHNRVGAEHDPAKRQPLISEAIRIHRDKVAKIMLHQQFLSWGMREGVNAVVPADEYTRFWYYTID